MSAESILREITEERGRQNAKFGEQNHPDGTGIIPWDQQAANFARTQCQATFAAGKGTWRLVLTEEVAEAYAESDPARLREELIQVAAVAAQWVEAIDRRNA